MLQELAEHSQKHMQVIPKPSASPHCAPSQQQLLDVAPTTSYRKLIITSDTTTVTQHEEGGDL